MCVRWRVFIRLRIPRLVFFPRSKRIHLSKLSRGHFVLPFFEFVLQLFVFELFDFRSASMRISSAVSGSGARQSIVVRAHHSAHA